MAPRELAAEQLVPEDESLDAAMERAYSRSLGPHVEDGHRIVDALVGSARESFTGTFRDARGIPREFRHPFAPALVDAFVVSSQAFAKAVHAAVDQAGTYDVTPREQIAAELDRLRREIQGREIALERIEAKRRADAEQEALAQLDKRAERVLGV